MDKKPTVIIDLPGSVIGDKAEYKKKLQDQIKKKSIIPMKTRPPIFRNVFI